MHRQLRAQNARGDRQTRALLAVIAGASTVMEVAEAIGVNKSTAWNHLARLRRDGFVAQSEGLHGTLHPLMYTVDVSETRG
jgi:DNA-binding IclR family transcriptional regulator